MSGGDLFLILRLQQMFSDTGDSGLKDGLIQPNCFMDVPNKNISVVHRNQLH